MLNKQKVIQELQQIVPRLFSTTYEECLKAYQIWQWLCDHPQEAAMLKGCNAQWPTPSWQEPLGTVHSISTEKLSYGVTAVDGSQIYPDKHQGISCYLLNIGTITLAYNDHTSHILCESVPYVFASTEDMATDVSVEIVNCHRTELELKTGLEVSKEFKRTDARPHLFLCDGSLIFWHLASKDTATKEQYLESYITLLEQFYNERLLIAGFISLPKSKELINILRTAVQKKLVSPITSSLDHIVDTDMLTHSLSFAARSSLFAHCSSIIQHYPAHLQPYFVYVHIGEEIIRMEIPAWIAQDTDLIDLTLRIAFDQSIKGHGYPVALSEAHEQAVVKNNDREFFFQILYRLSVDYNYKLRPSQKSLKKKFVSI